MTIDDLDYSSIDYISSIRYVGQTELNTSHKTDRFCYYTIIVGNTFRPQNNK